MFEANCLEMASEKEQSKDSSISEMTESNPIKETISSFNSSQVALKGPSDLACANSNKDLATIGSKDLAQIEKKELSCISDSKEVALKGPRELASIDPNKEIANVNKDNAVQCLSKSLEMAIIGPKEVAEKNKKTELVCVKSKELATIGPKQVSTICSKHVAIIPGDDKKQLRLSN